LLVSLSSLLDRSQRNHPASADTIDALNVSNDSKPVLVVSQPEQQKWNGENEGNDGENDEEAI